MISTREIPTFKQGGIVGGARDNTIRIWDVQSGREIKTLGGTHAASGWCRLQR